MIARKLINLKFQFNNLSQGYNVKSHLECFKKKTLNYYLNKIKGLYLSPYAEFANSLRWTLAICL